MKAILSTTTLVLSIFSASFLSASAATLTMDELPTQPVNGLSFSGITFHFTIGGVGSTDATYHGSNGGIEHFVQDPSLEGNASGVLTLDFAAPTAGLQFGVSRSISQPMSPGLQVSLFDSSLAPLGNFNVNTTVFNVFSEGQFTSALTIGRAVLSFPNAGSATRFAVDNLTFTPVPEPAISTLALLGLVALGVRIRRPRK
jgi:hypothetical protein